MKKILVATLAMVAFASTSFAAVILNADGTGFVGKGDVQLAFDWNNAQLQASEPDVYFTYEETGTYTVVCTGHSNPAQNPKTYSNKAIGVTADVALDLRKNKQGQITGFTLTGFDENTIDSTGFDCPTAWPTEVSRVANEDVGEVVGLFVHFNDQRVQIWQPVAE